MLRSLLLYLAGNRALRSWAEQSGTGRRISRRFVAGTLPQDVLATAAGLNRRGMSVSMDNLGENVSTPEEARRSADIYHSLLSEIVSLNLNANVSLKLTHMGLDIAPDLARELTLGLVSQAARLNNFVRVDMEGSAYTQVTLDMVRELHRAHPGRVGAVIQAYLRRSENDVRDLLREGIRIRLCKGAYQEPPELAFVGKAEVDANYVRLMKMLLESGVYHGIATHDERMIEETRGFARARKIPPEAFEFQMLYGIRRDLQESLVRQGWRLRVYVPFGTEWYPYLMRRLAERPANLWFVMKNLLRG